MIAGVEIAAAEEHAGAGPLHIGGGRDLGNSDHYDRASRPHHRAVGRRNAVGGLVDGEADGHCGTIQEVRAPATGRRQSLYPQKAVDRTPRTSPSGVRLWGVGAACSYIAVRPIQFTDAGDDMWRPWVVWAGF